MQISILNVIFSLKSYPQSSVQEAIFVILSNSNKSSRPNVHN